MRKLTIITIIAALTLAYAIRPPKKAFAWDNNSNNQQDGYSVTYGPNGDAYQTIRSGNLSTTYGPNGDTYQTIRSGNLSTTYGPRGETYQTIEQ